MNGGEPQAQTVDDPNLDKAASLPSQNQTKINHEEHEGHEVFLFFILHGLHG
jgi:hypothetical protein